jgi:hypothetical protein
VKNGVACNVGLKCELATHVIRFEFWILIEFSIIKITHWKMVWEISLWKKNYLHSYSKSNY